jgi:Plasmid encoded RepA protein
MGGKPFIVCNFPLRQLKDKDGKLLGKLTRINGDMKLDLITDPDIGVPCGRDRWIVFWLKTQASQQQSRHIPFPGAVKVLADMGFANNGQNLKWLREGFKRVWCATYFFGPKDVECSGIRSHFIDEIHVEWFNTKNCKAYDGHIVLSKQFFSAPAIPFDYEFLRLFGDNYGAMDLFTWLVWRWDSMRRSKTALVTISLTELRGQFGASPNAPQKKFKQQLKGWINDMDELMSQKYGGPSGVKVIDDTNTLHVPFRHIPAPKSKRSKQFQLMTEKLSTKQH